MEQNVVASEQGLLAPSRWARLLPLIFITYSLAYLDRVNFGFGSAGGLAKTLGITAGVSSLLSALFFLGYSSSRSPVRTTQPIAVPGNSSSWRSSPGGF